MDISLTAEKILSLSARQATAARGISYMPLISPLDKDSGEVPWMWPDKDHWRPGPSRVGRPK